MNWYRKINIRDSIVATTSDTVHVHELFVRNGKYGLKEHYQRDSLVNGIYIKDKRAHYTTLNNKVILVASNAQSIVTGRSLLPEFKDRITYDNYFSSRRSALRELSDLQTYYHSNKGQQGIEKEMQGSYSQGYSEKENRGRFHHFCLPGPYYRSS